MAFSPSKITREHVLAGIDKIEKSHTKLIPSTKWDVEINGKLYPPKEVMRFAHEQLNGEQIWNYSGGDATNDYLRGMGFAVLQKGKDEIQQLVERYKKHLKEKGLDGERYKWQFIQRYKGRPNPDATDLPSEIKEVKFANLIYMMGIKVIQHLAEARTEPYRACLKALFEEGTPLADRINLFMSETLRVYRELVPEKRFSHHHDERTIATLLAYHNPDKYALYKDSFYKKYCKLLDIPHAKKGYKYVHYLELLDNFISDYVAGDNQLLGLVRANLGSDCYADPTHKILAQDILYQTLDNPSGDAEGNGQFRTILLLPGQQVFKVSMSDKDGGISDAAFQYFLDNSTIAVHGETKPKGRSSETQGYIFLNSMKEGDYFYLCRANDSVQLLGKVIGEPIECDYQELRGKGWMQREYEVIEHSLKEEPYQETNKWWTPNHNSTCIAIPNSELNKANEWLFLPFFDTEFVLENKSKEGDKTQHDVMNQSLNQILFGPPGTGKTYHTINKALEIINEAPEKALNWNDREAVKKQFDERLKEGRIVFTTFHQSMSYEDFVEGIKPDFVAGQVVYDIEDGIFKQICQDAKFTANSNFDSAYKSLLEEIDSTVEGVLEIKTPKGNPFWISINSKGNLTLRTGAEKKPQGTLVKASLEKEAGGDRFFNWWKGYAAGVINHLEHKHNFKVGNSDGPKPYVLIIDEINRGNVSQIFGELITLIEEDKRVGNAEALEVTLPYSKEKFGVPPNLYIIGTMNTADRSVEALDTALRRRFSFVEMPPQPGLLSPARMVWELFWEFPNEPWDDEKYKAKEVPLFKLSGATDVLEKEKKRIWKDAKNKRDDNEINKFFNEGHFSGGINLQILLETINKRIEKLLDKDHLIGHSFFIKVNYMKDLMSAFYDKIIPLLQEYFYGDYGKIGLVLGKGFVRNKFDSKEEQQIFCPFDGYETQDFDERKVYEIIDYRKDDASNAEMRFEQAIQYLINPSAHEGK